MPAHSASAAAPVDGEAGPAAGALSRAGAQAPSAKAVSRRRGRYDCFTVSPFAVARQQDDALWPGLARIILAEYGSKSRIRAQAWAGGGTGRRGGAAGVGGGGGSAWKAYSSASPASV